MKNDDKEGLIALLWFIVFLWMFIYSIVHIVNYRIELHNKCEQYREQLVKDMPAECLYYFN